MTDPDRPPTARIVEAAFVLKNAGYADVAKFLLAKEKRARKKTDNAKPKRADVAQYGRKIKGGKTYVRMDNEQIEYIDMGAV